MRFVLATARKDLLRLATDPVGLLLWIGIPVLIGALITLAAGGKSGPAPKAHVLVADHDDNFLTQLLIGALSQDAAGGLVSAEAVDEEEGRARMAAGDASALLVIPAGFAQAVFEEQPIELALVTHPGQRILPGIVEELLSMFADAVFYLHRVIGEDLRDFAQNPPEGPFGDARVGAFSIKVNQIVERLEDWLSPLAIELETVAPPGAEEDSPGFAILFLPGLLLMGLLFVAQGLSEDVWQERAQGTLRRAVAAPRPLVQFLCGKLLAGLTVMAAVGLVALLLGFWYFDVPFVRLPAAVLWAALSGGLLLALMMLLQVMASSQRVGGILTLSVVFPLMMLGGSFFPFESMPDWMVTVGRRTPNGWSVGVLREIVQGAAGPGELLTAVLTSLAVVAFLFFLVAWRMRTRFVRGG